MSGCMRRLSLFSLLIVICLTAVAQSGAIPESSIFASDNEMLMESFPAASVKPQIPRRVMANGEHIQKLSYTRPDSDASDYLIVIPSSLYDTLTKEL